MFREADGFGEGAGSDYNFTARVTAVPWQDEDGLLHLGIAYSYKNASSVSYDARPESHLAIKLVDTGDIVADNASLLGLEAAILLGALSVQGEYMVATPDLAAGSDPDLTGYYIAASYFLTGEQRNYKAAKGAFGRVKPSENLGAGSGALEIAARLSNVDLSDKAVAGGELDDVTLGVNWYLNPNTRIMANYVAADLDGVGDVNVIETRFQIDF